MKILDKTFIIPTKAFWMINFVIFQLVWWLLVLKGNTALEFGAALILLHFILSPSKICDLKLMLLIAPIGIIIDTGLLLTGVFEFTQFPFWLGLLWLMLTLTFQHSLTPFRFFSIGLQSLLGGIFGTLSYFAGAKLNAVMLPLDLPLSLLILFIIWSIFFPLSLFITQRIIHSNPDKGINT